MFKGLGNIMSQLQEAQKKAEELHENLKKKIVEASAGGDMVTVKMNGNREILSIKINKEIVNPDDVEMLEDLIIAAINQAQEKVRDLLTEELKHLSGGMGFPGMSNLF
jgi:DNA-binding YbaB/EbfC family protein